MNQHNTLQKISEVALLTAIAVTAAAYLTHRNTKQPEPQHDIWAKTSAAWNLAIQTHHNAATQNIACA